MSASRTPKIPGSRPCQMSLALDRVEKSTESRQVSRDLRNEGADRGQGISDCRELLEQGHGDILYLGLIPIYPNAQ